MFKFVIKFFITRIYWSLKLKINVFILLIIIIPILIFILILVIIRIVILGVIRTRVVIFILVLRNKIGGPLILKLKLLLKKLRWTALIKAVDKKNYF